MTLRHVKAHGALYNVAVRDRALADAIARAIAAFDQSLVMFGLPDSALIDAGRAAGLRVAAEGFADRSYEPDGSLTPRSQPGAVIHDPDAVVARAVRMVRGWHGPDGARAAARAFTSTRSACTATPRAPTACCDGCARV